MCKQIKFWYNAAARCQLPICYSRHTNGTHTAGVVTQYLAQHSMWLPVTNHTCIYIRWGSLLDCSCHTHRENTPGRKTSLWSLHFSSTFLPPISPSPPSLCTHVTLSLYTREMRTSPLWLYTNTPPIIVPYKEGMGGGGGREEGRGCKVMEETQNMDTKSTLLHSFL